MSYIEVAKQWLDQDPDPVTRDELAELIVNQDEAALEQRFAKRISFGTAGLRAELGAGPARMNRVVVAQTAAGIARWLKSESEFIGGEQSIVIGYDSRINSEVFARDSAAIFAASGIRVVLFEKYVPTPVVAYAVKNGEFSMGIMVTASHNPRNDNGYKVYLGGQNGGSQIIAPVDKEISAHINDIAQVANFNSIPQSTEFETGGLKLIDDYLAQTATLVDLETQRIMPKIVYSAMHGVGFDYLRKLFIRVGFEVPQTVREQIQPDGTFPTVEYPNPEEPGAMNLALRLARETSADLVLVTDPDADRLAVAIPDSSGWRKLTGDEIGLLLGVEIADRQDGEGALATSIASSSALKEVAHHYALDYSQTLTGFKWITKIPKLIFGYEEALGYCVDPQHTPDKDGLSAALVIADIAGRLAVRGQNLASRLEQLNDKFGHHSTAQISIRFDEVAKAQEIVNRIRKKPPTELLDQRVKYSDFLEGIESLPSTDAIRLQLSDGTRVLIRPSGTEPKLKCYLEVIGKSAVEASEKMEHLETAVRTLLT